MQVYRCGEASMVWEPSKFTVIWHKVCAVNLAQVHPTTVSAGNSVNPLVFKLDFVLGNSQEVSNGGVQFELDVHRCMGE